MKNRYNHRTKLTQTQIDGGRIQCVNGDSHQRFELGARCIVGVKWVIHADQMMCHFGKDFQWPNAVRVGHDVARDRLAENIQMIEMLVLHKKIDFDITQRFAGGLLRANDSAKN